METRKRQRSVSQPKVHPVGEGGGAEILQQAGCKQDDAADFKQCLQLIHFGKSTAILRSTTLSIRPVCSSCPPPPRPGIPKR